MSANAALHKEFGDRLSIRAIDNSGKPGQEKLYKWEKIQPLIRAIHANTEAGNLGRMYGTLDRLHTTETIDPAVWNAANEGRSEPHGNAGRSQSLGRRGRASDGGEHQQNAPRESELHSPVLEKPNSEKPKEPASKAGFVASEKPATSAGIGGLGEPVSPEDAYRKQVAAARKSSLRENVILRIKNAERCPQP